MVSAKDVGLAGASLGVGALAIYFMTKQVRVTPIEGVPYLTKDESQQDCTLQLNPYPFSGNKRMALHLKPVGVGSADNWGALLALWNRGGVDEVVEFTWQNDGFLINTFKSGFASVRDIIFCCQAGEPSDPLFGEVARMSYNGGSGRQRFRVHRLQIPNSYPINLLDADGNETGKIYMYYDNWLVIENHKNAPIKVSCGTNANPKDFYFEEDGDLKLTASGKGVILTSDAGISKRLRLNDAGDSLILENP